MKPQEALYLAIGKERESAKLYRELAKDFPEAKETFIFLAAQEEKHEKIIEKVIEELPK